MLLTHWFSCGTTYLCNPCQMNYFYGLFTASWLLDSLQVEAFLLIWIHSFNKYVPSAYYVSSTLLGPEDTAANKTKLLLS